MKRIFAAALAVFLCLSILTACGGNSGGSGSTGDGSSSGSNGGSNGETSSGPVELVFWHNRGGSAGETLDKIVADFNENAGAAAGIHITAVYQNDTVSTLKTLVQAKDTANYPDMIQIFAGDVEYMSTVDAVVPLDDLMNGDSEFDAEVLSSLLNTYTYNGTLYSMPFHASTMGFFWNKTLFAEAGLDPETPPATIAEMAQMAEKLLKNSYLRIAAGGLVMALTVGVFGLYDFAGAGAHMIQRAVDGQALPWAFLLKLVLTALCVGTGFRGGEIVPTLFIGATFGCAVGPVLGLEPGFAAAVGMIALFCSVVNCPLASLLLAAEMFSTGELGLFAIGVAVAFVLSGYFGLYSSQRILFSKIKRGPVEGEAHSA